MSLQQSISSALSHPGYGCIFISMSKAGVSCFSGSISGLSWEQDSCNEGDTVHQILSTWRHQNPRKNPSSLLVHPIFHLLKYRSSVFASTEEELSQGWSTDILCLQQRNQLGLGCFFIPLASHCASGLLAIHWQCSSEGEAGLGVEGIKLNLAVGVEG